VQTVVPWLDAPTWRTSIYNGDDIVMTKKKEIIGGPLVIGGRTMSLSRAVRAGDMVYLTGQIPIKDGAPMTTGSIEEQTRVTLDLITETLAEADCTRDDVVKAMAWLRDVGDFPGFNGVYGEYFPNDPPARSAVLTQLLVDVRIEIEVVAYCPR
jgi:reactive intermediate/imine deaminase